MAIPAVAFMLLIAFIDGGFSFEELVGDTESRNRLVFMSVTFIAVVAAFSLAIGKINDDEQKRLNELLGDGEPAALDISLDIEIDHDALEILVAARPKVRKIVVMRTALSSDEGGGETLYSSFAIDVNGITHDIRTHHHHHEIEEHAKKLASILECPFDDICYG